MSLIVKFVEEPLIHIPNKYQQEVLLHILSFMEIKEIYLCMTLSKIWNEYTNDQRLWRRLCERLNSIEIKEFQGIFIF
jgi:hypothetical protein